MTVAMPPLLLNEFSTVAPGLVPSPHISQFQSSTDAVEKLSKLTGLTFLLIDPLTGDAAETQDMIGWLPSDLSFDLQSVNSPTAIESRLNCTVIAVPCNSGTQVAVTIVADKNASVPIEAVIVAAEHEWSQCRLDKWWNSASEQSVDGALRLCTLASKLLTADQTSNRLEFEVENLAEQIESTYEEISLLHFLAQNLQVSRETADLTELCLERLRESMRCDGAAAWLVGGSGESHFLKNGNFPLDDLQLAVLIARFDLHQWPQPLVCNRITETTLKGLPALQSLVVVPVSVQGKQIGWVVVANQTADREFGTVEASLLQSMAVSLGTHLQNAAVVAEREELLLSFVRSLVSSLDAKDAYTRGHSERVARIARRIGEELGLPDAEVEDIYLAGLVHDIGKIGVNDAILSKPGQLTDEEFAEIKRHPTVGYHILCGIKKLAHILPGVRSHHESFDGNGYPDQLAGYEIPTMARVLAVADSYDAMGSDRPYRNGMPLNKLEGILRDGRGKQWDPEVVDAYFACRDDIHEICLDWGARQVG